MAKEEPSSFEEAEHWSEIYNEKETEMSWAKSV
jgi:hypothetical protein